MTTRQAKAKSWFRVKRYGYGAGLPIAWEGWALLLCFIAGAILSALLLPWLASLTVMAVLTPALLLVARRRSDAEWRWRDGSEP